MSEKRKFQWVTPASGDWVCLLENGVCIAEGHSIRGREILELLGHDVESREIDDSYDGDHGSLWDNFYVDIQRIK